MSLAAYPAAAWYHLNLPIPGLSYPRLVQPLVVETEHSDEDVSDSAHPSAGERDRVRHSERSSQDKRNDLSDRERDAESGSEKTHGRREAETGEGRDRDSPRERRRAWEEEPISSAHKRKHYEDVFGKFGCKCVRLCVRTYRCVCL